MIKLRVREVMAILHCSRASLYRELAKGRLTRHADDRGCGRGGLRVWFDAYEIQTLAKEMEKKRVEAEQAAALFW